MSVVLCLPAHLCVSTAAFRGQAPNGNASKALHRRGVTHPSRATHGHQPRAAQRSSSQLAARSAVQRLAAPPSDSAKSVKEVRRPELSHQRVPSADQQGRTPSYSNYFHNHRPTSTGRTPRPVLRQPLQQPPPGPVRGAERDTTKDLKTNYAPRCHGKLARSEKTWPQPHPHAVRLLRGLVWDQHYLHSHPQCEGGMPGSFELRVDMGPDRLQAVEDWLRVEGFAFRFQQRRWRVWTRPDRPSEGLRIDGIEEDENSHEYPSGATINVSMWDMIEKNFPEPGSERRLQGSSSSASPGKEKRSAGDRKRDQKWREYQESLAAEAAQGAKGGTPAPSPQPASGGHDPGHTTLGYFPQVAKHAKAKSCQLLLRKSGPSSDVESAHRGRMPADQASSSSSVAPDQRDVARACERACGVPCNLRVARQRATQQKAATKGAVGIAQQEAVEWVHGMAIHASAVAAIAAGLTAGAAHEAATAEVKGEVAAADEEARLTQEAIACKEAEVKALEEALAQERAKKEAEERAHAEGTAKAQADAAKKDAIEAARRRSLRRGPRRRRSWRRWKRRSLGCSRPGKPKRLVPGRKPRGELLQPQPPQWRRRRPSSAARLPRDDHEWKPFESFSKGTPPRRWRWIRRRWTRAAVGAVAPLPIDGARARGRPPRGQGGQWVNTPKTATPSSPPATGMNEAADIAEEWLAEEAETSPWSQKVRMRISLLPTGARSPPRPRRPGGATWTRMTTWTSTSRRSAHPRTHRGDLSETHRDPLAEDHQDPLEDAHQVDPLEADHRAEEDPLDLADPAEALLEDPPETPTTHQGTATRMPPDGGLSTSAGGSSPSGAR